MVWTPRNIKFCFKFTATDRSNFDKRWSDEHFLSFLFYYYCKEKKFEKNHHLKKIYRVYFSNFWRFFFSFSGQTWTWRWRLCYLFWDRRHDWTQRMQTHENQGKFSGFFFEIIKVQKIWKAIPSKNKIRCLPYSAFGVGV